MEMVKKVIKRILIGCWAVLAIFTTICLIQYNDFKVSEFGDYSLFVIDNKTLEPTYKKYDLVIVEKNTENSYNVGDNAFFYLGNVVTKSYINYGEITAVKRNDKIEDIYTFSTDDISYGNIIGSSEDTIVIHKLGALLALLESRWGFMFLIILPTIYAIVYEVYYIAVEVKKETKKEAKEKNED